MSARPRPPAASSASRPPPLPREDALDGEDFFGPLLRTLAESLDVREIFARISTEARRIVPHDFLMLGLLSEDGQRVRVTALSGEMPPIPADVLLPETSRLAIAQESFIVTGARLAPGERTVEARLATPAEAVPRPITLDAQPLFRELVGGRGFHSFLRVGVQLRGGVVGGLVFCAVGDDAYMLADLARARQIADCVALAVAHQRLAEEEQRSAEAREHATRLEARVQRLSEALEQQGRHRLLGRSRKWQEVLNQAAKVAGTEATVLLTGESGTGKEVVARFIHRASPRAAGPFVAINCAALPEQLLESELFGHEKGAFTGALSARPGKIELAAGGTLFLDEAGEMSPAVQAKLLRVLQEREFERVGAVKPQKADIRVLAATHRDLKAAIGGGAFREDLYYRLGVFDLVLPPLRERADDILPLADAFLQELRVAMGRPASEFAPEVRERLLRHGWPGNVRELRNVIERGVILCEGTVLTLDHLPSALTTMTLPSGAAVPRGASVTLDAAERAMIVDALARAGNNKSRAARLLGLTRGQLRSRIEKHRLPA